MTRGDAGEAPKGVVSARTWLVAAAAAVALGLAVAGTLSQIGGGVIVVLGWLGFVFSLHRYGRVGSAER